MFPGWTQDVMCSFNETPSSHRIRHLSHTAQVTLQSTQRHYCHSGILFYLTSNHEYHFIMESWRIDGASVVRVIRVEAISPSLTSKPFSTAILSISGSISFRSSKDISDSIQYIDILSSLALLLYLARNSSET